ncbi:MAG: ROK family protein [Parcubacteria group bacterium]|nr:ROK family protein [Parcubacteria group bacterium]
MKKHVTSKPTGRDPDAKRLGIGIDIGGTKIRGVLHDGRRIKTRAERKYAHKPPHKKDFLISLFGVVDELLDQTLRKRLRGIGVGSAGVIAKERIWAAGNLDVVNRIDIKKELVRRYKVPVRLTNDVKTAALGEWRLGAGRNTRSLVMITVGTGTGGAHILNGEIQRGAFDSAYEVGNMILDSRRTRERERADFEWFTSEKFFHSKGLDPIVAEAQARHGNKEMKKLWRMYGEYLGMGIANLINVIEPEIVVIGGGIAHAWPLFAPRMKQMVKRFVGSPFAKRYTKIVRAELGRDAGAIGAALLIIKKPAGRN